MIECHHRIFKSQGGLDYELNYVYLTSEEHKGNDGPHRNRETDLRYKKELQEALEGLLVKDYYTVEELVELLSLKQGQANKAFKRLISVDGISREDAIKRLLGGRFYL